MISSEEALERSLKNTENEWTLHGRIWKEIVESSKRGDTQAQLDIGMYSYSDEIIEKNMKLLKMKGFDLRLTNHFSTLIVKW